MSLIAKEGKPMTLLVGANITAPQFDNIPIELRALPQWCCWISNEVWDEKKQVNKLSKEPANIKTKRRLAWRNPKNLYTFDEVKEAYEKGGFNGVGLVLYEDTPLVCVDIDDLDDVNNIPAHLHNYTIHSYTEKSPSGNGLHLWIKGHKPDHVGTKKNGIEFFGGQARFITMTGDLYNSMPVMDNQKLIDMIAEEFFGKPKAQKKSPKLSNEGKSLENISDSMVVDLIQRFKPKSFKVYQGDFSDYPSQSEAVLGLMNDLAFYTGKDEAQMERIFLSSSATYETQKETAHKFSLALKKALEGTQNVYKPKVSNHSITDYSLSNQGTNEQTVEVLAKPGQSNNPYSDVLQLLETNDKGNILKTAFNVAQILDSRIFAKTFGYDVFRQREVIFRDLPWRSRQLTHKKFEQWQPADDAQLRHFLRYHFSISGTEMIMDTLTSTFRQNSFHPVKNYVRAVPWDKQPRIETFFIDYLGAEDIPYTRSVARKWFAAAVKRIFEPGCKFDYMPVLVGEQGVGKSTAIQKLAPNYFNDSLRNFDVKESGEILQTSWIIEIGELAAMKKSEEEEMKGFLSRQIDSFRPAYARSVQDFPRHCVFMGTTNNYEFLKDTTGNRRFLPIKVSDQRKYTPWNDLDEMTVHQLWAEAYTLYAAGENVDLEDEIKEVAKMIQAEFTESDVREGVIQDYLEMLLPDHWDNMTVLERKLFFQDGKQGTVKRDCVCTLEIWKECLGEYDEPTRMDSKRIIGILNKLGWKPRTPSRKRFKHYSIQRAYEKK